MAAALPAIATFMTGGITEINRRLGEAAAEEIAKPQKEEAKKLRDEQAALQAQQKKELDDLEKGKELVKLGNEKSKQVRASAGQKDDSNLLGAFNSSTAQIKTLLGS